MQSDTRYEKQVTRCVVVGLTLYLELMQLVYTSDDVCCTLSQCVEIFDRSS
jgi:hypothetical protein